MHATNMAAGVPAWVYVLLVALIALGVRRLKTRDLPIAVALLPSAAFVIWSVLGGYAFALQVGSALALAAWLVGGAVGAGSAVLLPDRRGELIGGGRVRQPASVVPLVLYIYVFLVKFACGAWAAIEPQHAPTATAIGIATGAAVTVRLLSGVARWRPANSLAV